MLDFHTPWSKLPRPGPLGAVTYSANTKQHSIDLPPIDASVARRRVFFYIAVFGFRRVEVALDATKVSYEFPKNVPVIAHVVDECEHCQRSLAGPIKLFRTIRNAPPKPGRLTVFNIQELP